MNGASPSIDPDDVERILADIDGQGAYGRVRAAGGVARRPVGRKCDEAGPRAADADPHLTSVTSFVEQLDRAVERSRLARAQVIEAEVIEQSPKPCDKEYQT